jgi:hypothetical protein
MALRFTLPVNRNEYQKMFLRSKARPAHRAENLTTLLTDHVENVGSSASHNPVGLRGLLQEWLYIFSFVV